jgi:hypothetical protein
MDPVIRSIVRWKLYLGRSWSEIMVAHRKEERYSEILSVYNYKITLKENHQLEVLFDVAFDSLSVLACRDRIP